MAEQNGEQADLGENNLETFSSNLGKRNLGSSDGNIKEVKKFENYSEAYQ